MKNERHAGRKKERLEGARNSLTSTWPSGRVLNPKTVPVLFKDLISADEWVLEISIKFAVLNLCLP